MVKKETKVVALTLSPAKPPTTSDANPDKKDHSKEKKATQPSKSIIE